MTTPVSAREATVLSNLRSLTLREGVVEIEGVVQRMDGETGAAALARLTQALDAEGPGALARAQGDFVAAMRVGSALHLFKSFTSQFQLYYRASEGRASNRLAAFAAGGAEWDVDYFARHVLIVPGHQFLARETPVARVCRVLPGEMVTLQSGAARRRTLVRRDYVYKLDAGQTREEMAGPILDLLRDAIRTRLAARPGAGLCVEISGGLDSSFVACLLAQEAAVPVRGVMFSQPNLPSHAVSEGYARAVAERYGVELHVLAPQDLPAGPPSDPGYADEPSDFFWFGDIFSRAVADLADPGSYVFTGFGADQLFLRSPAFLPYLLKRRAFRAFFAALPDASALLGRGAASLMRQSALSRLPERAHRALRAAWPLRGWDPFDVGDVDMERTLTSDVPWLLCGKGLAAYTRERKSAEAAQVGSGIICDDWGYFSAPRAVTQPHFAAKGLIDASPFCDLALLDHMYGEVSALLVHDFASRYKELLRAAQKDIVPEALRNRRNDTFVFNSFQTRYVDASRDRFESLLDGVDEAWIDRAGARLALQQLSFGMASSSTRSVNALLGYLQWRSDFVRHARAASSSAGLDAIDAIAP